MGEIENKKRCIKCKYYGCNTCPLMADAYVYDIDKCILEHNAIKSIREDSLDDFVFYNNPKLYLSYLGFKEKDNYLKVQSYINSIKKIREEVCSLVDELWQSKENRDVYGFKNFLKDQVVHDILNGYEFEE